MFLCEKVVALQYRESSERNNRGSGGKQNSNSDCCFEELINKKMQVKLHGMLGIQSSVITVMKRVKTGYILIVSLK